MAQSRLPTPKSYGYGSGSTRSQANGSPRASGVPNSTSPSRLPLSKPVSQVPSSPTKLPARKSSSRSHPAQPSKLPLSSSHGNGFPSSANGKPLRPPPMIQSTRKNSAQLYFEQVSPTSQHPPELPPEQQGPTSNLSSESSQESQRSYPLQTPETERPQPPSPTPQVHPISSNLSSDEAHERMLRAGMLRRLEDMFGPRVLDDVEPLSVISLGDSPTGDNLAASTNTNAMKSTSSELSKRWSAESAKAPSLKRTASGGSGGTEKKKRGGLFSSFRRSKKPDANSNAKGVSSAGLCSLCDS